MGRQDSIDLTSKSAFRIGRSPNCDVQLMHATSSRRHAMVFHHSNGSCYVVDCGSAHGTFVNGRRIACPAGTGVVVPHKMRRGAIVRFGGPGAPSFILKSLPSHLNNVDWNDSRLSDEALLVLRNTRLNALGKSSLESMTNSKLPEITNKRPWISASKRSFESLSSQSTTDDLLDDESVDGPICKRVRCSSPPLFPEEPLRLVSPDLPSMTKPRHVSFAVEDAYFYPASITPDESSEEDNSSL
jgi:FHA domain